MRWENHVGGVGLTYCTGIVHQERAHRHSRPHCHNSIRLNTQHLLDYNLRLCRRRYRAQRSWRFHRQAPLRHFEELVQLFPLCSPKLANVPRTTAGRRSFLIFPETPRLRLCLCYRVFDVDHRMESRGFYYKICVHGQLTYNSQRKSNCRVQDSFAVQWCCSRTYSVCCHRRMAQLSCQYMAFRNLYWVRSLLLMQCSYRNNIPHYIRCLHKCIHVYCSS